MCTKLFNSEMYMSMEGYTMQMLMQWKLSLFCAPYVT